MKPVRALPVEEARRLRGLLFDLDDTVLTHGVLTRSAYDAVWQMHEAGLILVGVTGRPSGWGEVLVRQWPIAGCVTENGGVWLARVPGGVRRHEAADPVVRSSRHARLAELVRRASEAVPEARLTEDSDLRRSDVAWDVAEHMTLPEERTRALILEIERAGARWSRSSVHLHATFEVDDKASGALRFCAIELGEEAGAALVHFGFVGDSGNDAPCFAAFRTTFGVANVLSSLASLTVVPRYVAAHAMGEGFAEIASEILRKR